MRRAEHLLQLACVCALLLVTTIASAQPVDAGVRTLASLSTEERAALQRRLEAWEALPESMRRDRREAWQAWRALPADERARMRAARDAFLSLPIAEQQALRARFDALDAGIRRGWLLGPTLGGDWPQLHALFAQVPADEREALLAALRTLPPQARDDLGVLAQRTPPQDRELLAQAPDQRAGWLRRRVAP
ncbi:MAG TPA: DUF3106 domain-containing protein [Luteimonas sp.]|nr:DUF3106 domain-containing protein [Luteimonas sp.]